jgi:subtilisin family serine protease
MTSNDARTTDDYRARRLRVLEKRYGASVRVADGYLYRPNDLLVTAAAEKELGPSLERELRAAPYRPGTGWRAAATDRKGQDDLARTLEASDLGLRLWQLPDDTDPGEAVLRVRAGRSPGLGVSLNHVLAGEPRYAGGPAQAPVPTPDAQPPAMHKADLGDPVLGVLDTGLPANTPTEHPFVAATSVAGPHDVDLLDAEPDGFLDSEAGHGLFIAGLVQRVAPGLPLVSRRVLDSYGYGDDLSVALGLMTAKTPVVNLSLGGYTQDDRPPLALLAALTRLGRDVVVVAAAGNDGSERLFWPAAFKHVVAVAAYDAAAGQPASWSNRGWWVDACAPGVGVLSAYVDGSGEGPGGASVPFTGWARWSGTSFAAPLVAAEIAHRLAADPRRTARQVAQDFLGELDDAPWDGMGALYKPAVDPSA